MAVHQVRLLLQAWHAFVRPTALECVLWPANLVSTFAAAAAAAAAVPQALLRELLIASEDRMALMAGPEFVYIIAALAKLRAAPDQAWLNR
jgi:acyl-CoA synthetase (AMP-forming)/AMP-acid ligase II